MKKDAFWITFVLWWMAIACIASMVFFKLAESWSQNHTLKYDFLLYGAVILIGAIYLIRGISHPRKEKPCFVLGNMEIRNKTMNKITAFCFFAIAIFGVNSELKWVETLHLVATGAGILFGLLGYVFDFRKNTLGFYTAILVSTLSALGFVIGYRTELYTTADGEGIVALPLALWLILTTKKE